MKNLCILPWIHLEADPNGKAKPCCLNSETVGDFNTQSFFEIWNSKDLNLLRQDFLNGNRPSSCEQCWKNEDSGIKSKRLTELDRFSKYIPRATQETIDLPIYLDLKLSKLCNLKCRSCSSHSSSKWASDEKKLFNKVLNNNKSQWVDDNDSIWKDFENMLPYIEQFDFSGGEPLLIKKHFELLKSAVEKNVSKNITLHYNTNGTIMPTQDMIDTWKKFKNVEIMLSVDGIEDRFEYLRYPGKWQQFIAVFLEFKKHSFLHVTICHTISSLNILYLDEFISWTECNNIKDYDLFLNILHFQEMYSIVNLPKKVKDIISKNLIHPKTKPIVNFMNSSNEKNLLPTLLNITEKLDSIRREKFSMVFPELYAIYNNEFIF